MSRTVALRVRPDPVVVKRQNDLFDLWTSFAVEHGDDLGYDPDDDPVFVERARQIMGLSLPAAAPTVTKCVTCGCDDPDNDHGDHRHITASELQAAADAAGITPGQALRNAAHTMRWGKTARRVEKRAQVVTVAGLAVRAQDTGRVLMIQRAVVDDDPAAGDWEMPSGHLEDDETPLEAARREWVEETGLDLPKGEVTGSWTSKDGHYQGFVYSVPTEDAVSILDGRDGDANPDADGDLIEALAWWEPRHLKDNPAVRAELAASLKRVRRALKTAPVARDAIGKLAQALLAKVGPKGYIHNWIYVGSYLERQTGVREIASRSDLTVSVIDGGAQARTTRETTPDGRTIVRKVFEEFTTARRDADAEELGSLVLAATGVDGPAVVRVGPAEIAMEYVPGDVGTDIVGLTRFGEPRRPGSDIAESDDARLIGLADVLMANEARGPGNWIRTPAGGVVPIDSGEAFSYDNSQPGLWTPFAEYLHRDAESDDQYLVLSGDFTDNDLSPADVAIIRARLVALRPEFKRLGHLDWWDYAVARLDEIAPHAKGARNRVKRKAATATLAKRVRDADHDPHHHRYRHGWIPLGGIADLLAADVPDDCEVPLADLPAADTLAHRAFDHTANGLTARVDPQQSQVYRHPEHGLTIQAGGAITDTDGQIVGSFRRYLYPESRTVHDDSFALAEEHQRQGFYRGFTAQSDRELAAAGFERVTSSPAIIGGYARAAAGDTWDSTARRAPYGDVPTRIIDTLSRGEVSEADRATLMGWLEAFRGDRDGWPSPQEIARHGEIGRTVMVGASWQSEHRLTPPPQVAKARNYHPDRYRHWWIPLDEIAFDEDLDLPSGRSMTAILRDDGRIYLGLGGNDLLLHTEDADHFAHAIDTQLNLPPDRRDEQTILTSTGDVELGPNPNGDGLLLRRVDPQARSAEAVSGNMAWTLSDDDAEAVSELLGHLGNLQRAEPTSLHRVSDELAWTLLSSGTIAPILGGASVPEPVSLGGDEARGLADALKKLAKKKIPVTTGSGVKGLRALLGGRKKSEHTEVASVTVGRARVGWWSDGLVTVEIGGTEVQMTAADVAGTVAALRELAGRSDALLGKWLAATLTKRRRDIDGSSDINRYRHGWVPLVRPALTDAADIPAINKAITDEARRITGRDIHVDLDGSDPQIAREHGEGILQGLERYPDITLAFIVTGYLPPGVLAAAQDGRTIAFDMATSADRAGYLADLARGGGRHLTAPTPMGIALHEFGHLVANQHDLNERVDSAAAAAAEEAGSGTISGFVMANISRRAGVSMRELAAEVFADVLANGEAAKPLSRRIYDAVFGPIEGAVSP